MATSAMISEQQYLTTSYEHDCEWIDGQVRERAMPDEFHSALQAFFVVYFASLGRTLSLRVRPELRIRVATRRYRIPDITILPLSAPLQAIPDTPPLICIEILSPEDRRGELQEKIADYVAMGVAGGLDRRSTQTPALDSRCVRLAAGRALPRSQL